MKKKLPEIFKKEVNQSHINNKRIFYVTDTKIENENIPKVNPAYLDSQTLSVEDKIKKLFKSSRYIFNIGVVIKTDKKDYDTKIAGRVKNSIVTVDNDVIPIVEINDIIIKDRI